MVIKGRSRSNGAQLADYLLNSKGNDRAQVLEVRGTTRPNDLQRSLVEMSLSSELTKRGKLGLYHAQVNPAIGEDRPMTPADWLRAADILEQHLGFTGQKRAIVLHEKEGRLHGHVVWERYDHDTGKLRADGKNYEKHDKARAEIEQELSHERTPQRSEKEPADKDRLTELWQKNSNGSDFVKAAEQAGYYIAQGNDRRPFRVITPDGQSLDLVRQLDGIKTKEVRDRLQPIRSELLTEGEAVGLASLERDYTAKQQGKAQIVESDKSRELSDSQDRMQALKTHYKQQVEPEKEPPKVYSYSFKIEQPPTLPRQPDKKTQSDNSREISDSQDVAAAMLKQRQAARQERQRKEQEAQQQAKAQTAPANDKDPLAKFRFNKEDDKLAQFRGKNDRSRSNERSRERGLDE